MYNNITMNTISKWLTLLVSIIIIVFFILLIVLYSLVSNKNNNTNLLLSNNVYTTNMNNLKTSAKEYFTKDMLPENSTVITLKEMLDKRIILNLYDENGNECEVNASYVQIIKLDNKYQMNLVLECGGKTDILVNYFDIE